jgi:hypothetical protein
MRVRQRMGWAITRPLKRITRTGKGEWISHVSGEIRQKRLKYGKNTLRSIL